MGVTPNDVLSLTKPSEKYLCNVADNVYNVEFVAFKIRDLDRRRNLYEISRDVMPAEGEASVVNYEATASAITNGENGLKEEDIVRFVRYDFGQEFLQLKTVGTTVTFTIGDKPIPNFRMIERHYFRNHLIKSFDFSFGFCIPNSTNAWETIYEMPKLESSLEDEMVNNPYQSKSDSFYFVDNKLVMHSKAEYSFAKPSYQYQFSFPGQKKKNHAKQ